MTISLLVIQLACSSLLAVLVTSGIRYLLIRPRNWHSPATNLVVLAAHPDDCVVLAGEYALWVLAQGMKVDIVYFTSGADDPASSRAKTREREALAAWSSVGVPETNLHFLEYGQSPMKGSCILDESALAGATEAIKNIIVSAMPGTAIFVPAAGETHADHRTTRRVGLAAVIASGRKDLLVLEAPEYNPCLSLARSPGKVVRYFLKALPLIWRFGGKVDTSAFPGFIRGDGAYMLGDEAISDRKNQMFRHFASEDGEKLVRHFGFQNQFRPVIFPISPQDEHYGAGFVKIGKYRFGLSVVGLWFAIYLLTIGLFWQIPEKMTTINPGSKLLLPVCGMLTIFLLYAGTRAHRRAESVLLYVSGIVGIIGGLLRIT
jgi:LmbE family N-acetylglucosaminyl deacetylase